MDDLLLRRSALAWLGLVSRPVIEELAEVMGAVLGWSADQKLAEVGRAVDVLRDRHGLSF